MIPSDTLNALLNAPTVEDLWNMHQQHMAHYGFDRLIYGFTRFRTANSLGDPDDFVLLTNHDKCYTQVFVGEGLYAHAPMVRWALEHDGAGSWSVLYKMMQRGELSEDEKRVVQFNRAHGVEAGYSVSFQSISPRAKGAIALTARRGVAQSEVDALWAREGEDITLLNNIFHLRLLALPHATPGRRLTRRQCEVLGWIGDGKTIQDTATLMGLTAATVEKHLRLARQVLNVETTAQAVLKAAFQNQIFVLDS